MATYGPPDGNRHFVLHNRHEATKLTPHVLGLARAVTFHLLVCKSELLQAFGYQSHGALSRHSCTYFAIYVLKLNYCIALGTKCPMDFVDWQFVWYLQPPHGIRQTTSTFTGCRCRTKKPSVPSAPRPTGCRQTNMNRAALGS